MKLFLLFAFVWPAAALWLLALVAPHLVGILLSLLLGAVGWIGYREYSIKNKNLRHFSMALTVALAHGANVVAKDAGGATSLDAIKSAVAAAALKYLMSGAAFAEVKTDWGKTDDQLLVDLGDKLDAQPQIITNHPVLKEIVPLPDAKPGDGSPSTLVRPISSGQSGQTRVLFALVLMLLASFVLAACAHFQVPKSEEQQLIDCGSSAIAKEVPTYLPKVTSALEGQKVDWSNDLDSLIMAGGSAAICAVSTAITDYEAGLNTVVVDGTLPADGGAPVPTQIVKPVSKARVALMRAYSYVLSRGRRVKSAPKPTAPMPDGG